MKTYRFFALVGVLAIIPYCQPTAAARVEQAPMEETPNSVDYVVIGAFSVHRNAMKFTAHAHQALKLNARFEMNPSRNLYYVYVLSTDDHSLAIREALRLRQESTYTDTWVYHGSFQKAAALHEAATGDINPVTQQHMADVKSHDLGTGAEAKTDDPAASPIASANTESSSLLPSVTTAVDAPANKPEPDDGVDGKRFVFKLVRVQDQKVVEGEVNAVDIDRVRKMGTYKGNVPVKISSPGSKSGQVSLVSEVFGYRKVQHEVNYNTPEGEGVTTNEQGAVVVPFDLVRLRKGDIAVMYNVFFFKDAAIMRPESRYEVNSLLEMMNENPKCKIKLHGHTNGGAAGKIISKAPDNSNFFSLNDAKEGFGTAKQLSEARAEAIRDYLLSNGIDSKRIEIKAWGGKRPLQDKNGAHAAENVRVEVEIMAD